MRTANRTRLTERPIWKALSEHEKTIEKRHLRSLFSEDAQQMPSEKEGRVDELILHAVTVFMGFFAIMNPVANTPIFLGLTAQANATKKKAIARKAIALTLLIVLIFCVAGKVIFALFGISLAAFRITGGILVFLIGFHMLQGEPSRVHNPSADDNQKSLEAELSIAISPLAVPILAGPGTISTAMNFVATGGLEEFVITMGAFTLLCALTYGFFIFGEKVIRYIGESAVKVVTRMMGLILAVIGTQMCIQGISGAIESFAR